jgi:hypothetical protein
METFELYIPKKEQLRNIDGTPPFLEDEQNIADAVVRTIHNIVDKQIPYVDRIILLLLDADVEVSYVQGYVWYNSLDYGYINLPLFAPDGITCFLRIPEPAPDEVTYLSLNIGKRDNGAYYNHIYGYRPMWHVASLDDHFNKKPTYQPLWDQYFSNKPTYLPLEENVKTFELYIPPR